MKIGTAAATISLIIIVIASFGQLKSIKDLPQADNNRYVYCEIWEQDQGNFLSGVKKIFLNFGEYSTYQKQSVESNKIRTLKDVVDALNFMSENGWELVTKNLREIDGGTEVCYLLRRKK